MADKVDKTGKAVIAWKSKITGFVDHGQPMPVEVAMTRTEEANRKYPMLDHVAVPAGKVDETVEAMKKS